MSLSTAINLNSFIHSTSFCKKSWCLSIARLFLLPKKENSVKQVTVQMRNKPSNKRRTSNKMSGCCCCLLNPLMLWFSSRKLLIQFRKYISVLNQLPLSRIGSYCRVRIRELHAIQFFVCQQNFQRDARVHLSGRRVDKQLQPSTLFRHGPRDKGHALVVHSLVACKFTRTPVAASLSSYSISLDALQ